MMNALYRPAKNSTRDWNLYELLYLIHMNDEEAYALLFASLRGYTDFVYNNMLRSLLLYEDWIAAAYDVFDRLIYRYRDNEKCSIGTVYYACLRNKATDLIRSANQFSSLQRRNTLSLEACFERREFGGPNIQNCFQSDMVLEENHLAASACDEVLAELSKELDALDMQILTMLRTGYTQKQTSAILSITLSRVGTALRRARSAWKRHEVFSKELMF